MVLLNSSFLTSSRNLELVSATSSAKVISGHPNLFITICFKRMVGFSPESIGSNLKVIFSIFFMFLKPESFSIVVTWD